VAGSLDPGMEPLARGCHLNRNMPALLATAGFKIEELKARYLAGPRPLTYIFVGAATRT